MLRPTVRSVRNASRAGACAVVVDVGVFVGLPIKVESGVVDGRAFDLSVIWPAMRPPNGSCTSIPGTTLASVTVTHVAADCVWPALSAAHTASPGPEQQTVGALHRGRARRTARQDP